MATFPPDYTMKKYGLVESDLTEDASDALAAFDHFLSKLTRQKKEFGSDWAMTKAQQKKINRLSRAVCTEVEMMIEDAPDPKPEPKREPKPEPKPEPNLEAKAKPQKQPIISEDDEEESGIFDLFF